MTRPMIRNVSLALLAGALVVAALGGCGDGAPSRRAPHPLEARVVEASLADLQQGMEDGSLTSEGITEAYLARIERWNRDLRAVIAINPQAIEQARALDAERAAGEVRGWLHGIPVLLKDNIETSEDLPTTAGSLALLNNVTGRDAHLTALLREAGAVILGKANLSEWANFRSERSSSGWSAVGGQARNPYDPTRTPCGSSSGSGVAVAASLSALAIGTETNGSIVCPSHVNGIVGIKPTVGLVSRRGIVPISHSQDTAGPMARSVTDATLLLQAISGVDSQDPVTARAGQVAGRNLAAHLDPKGLEGKRIGVVRSLAGYHEAVDALLDQAVADLRAAGAEIVDDLEFQPPDGFGRATYDVLLYEFKHDLDAYLASLPSEDLSKLDLAALVEFNVKNADTEMRWFRQEIFEKSQTKGTLEEQAYIEALALAQKATREQGIDALMAEHSVDALLAPTGAPAWKIDLVDGDHFLGGSSTYAAVSGYPAITVPMGLVHGLPVGVSFFAGEFSEPTLIEIAYAYEQVSARRVPPRLEGDD